MLVGLFIAFIMVFSIFGFVIDYAVQPGSAKYGAFKFKVVNERYVTKINGNEYRFLFFPRDLEYINVSDDVKQLFSKHTLIVTYDSNSELAENFGEAQYYFETQLNGVKVIERALTGEGTLPKKSCADATAEQPVIELRKGEESSISAENNCIIVSVLDAYSIYQQTERLVYSGLGVMS